MLVREARRAVLPALAEIGKIPATKKEDDPGEPWEVMAERYINYLHRCDRHGKPVVRSAYRLERLIRRFLIPPWRGMPGRQITREMTIDVLVAHKEVRPNPLAGKPAEKRTIGGPFACRNLHNVAHAMFGWLADPPVDISRSRFIPANPVPSDGEKIHGLTAEDCKRSVWLDRESKLVAVWQAAGVMIEKSGPGGSIFGRLTRLALAEGQRRSQFAKLRRDQVEDGKLWFGRDQMKENAEHVLPLTTYIDQQLSILPIINDSPYYFTVNGDVPFNSFGYYHSKLRELSGVPDFTQQDLRRTMRSWLGQVRLPNGRRIDTDIREMILAHARQGMEKVYDVSTCLEYQDEMKEALEAWQTRLLGLVEGGMK
jgi:integrase